jgi:hypothetical protein
MHTLISLIFSYKSYSVATPRHIEPLSLKNHVCIIALTPDLQSVSFYSVIDFLHLSFTTELIPSLILIKEPYPSSKASLRSRESSSALWLLWRVNLGKVAMRINTSSRATNDFGLERNNPAPAT